MTDNKHDSLHCSALVHEALAEIRTNVQYIRNGMDLQNVRLADAMNNLSEQIKLMVAVNARSVPIRLVLVIFALVFGLVFGIEVLQVFIKGGLLGPLLGVSG